MSPPSGNLPSALGLRVHVEHSAVDVGRKEHRLQGLPGEADKGGRIELVVDLQVGGVRLTLPVTDQVQRCRLLVAGVRLHLVLEQIEVVVARVWTQLELSSQVSLQGGHVHLVDIVVVARLHPGDKVG